MKLLITGGAGFLGSNLADFFIAQGAQLIVYDNLSRRGTVRNLDWLRRRHGNGFKLVEADVRDFGRLSEAAAGVEVIFHLAAQVAVTTSVTDPREDFEVNALGTFNVLEAARQSGLNPLLVFTSTNKVYGGLEDLAVEEHPTAYGFRDLPHGIGEDRPLDFHSPYGCSKGAADQYVRDYSRIYGLPTVVFRMSCIYGPRQFGSEDQGWLAHFVISACLGRPITIYGDGKQVRDVLFVDDLVRAFELAAARPDRSAGQVYNLGGGAGNALAVWAEFGPMLQGLLGREIPVEYCDWRPGDQRIYVSDIRKASQHLSWDPKIGKEEGIARLVRWVQDNREQFSF